jgi:molybdate transport system substrate-binding protein
MTRYSIVLVVMITVWSSACRQENPSDHATLRLFVASSLTDVMHELVGAYERDNPEIRIQLHVAASSVLAKQIESGAPADVFFSADSIWVAYLNSRKRVSRVFYPVSNRLVWVSNGPLEQVLGSSSRISLADPLHVPAGRYALTALSCLDRWEEVQDRVIPGLNVRAALATVENGYAGVGIVYATDIGANRENLAITPIPPDCQPRIRYAAALVSGARNPSQGQKFLDFMLQERGRQIWRTFGFMPCETEGDVC